MWVRDTRKGFETIEGHEVLGLLEAFGRRHEFGTGHHVIGGTRYARNADAARRAGWQDMARFFTGTKLFGGQK